MQDEGSVEGVQAAAYALQSASAGVGAAAPVVGDRDAQGPVGVAEVDADLGGAGVFGGVGKEFRDGEVAGGFHGGREPAGQGCLDVYVEVAVEGQ